MSSADGCVTALMVLVLFVGALWAGSWMGKGTTDAAWRDLLAKRGVAEFYLDANNSRQWRWKDEPK
jgi:hypothetical protein